MVHRFRFFVEDDPAAVGDVVALAPRDAAHAVVLRLVRGDLVEVVSSSGAVWTAAVEQLDPPLATARVLKLHMAATEENWVVELFAGVSTGGVFDELVDGAVQAGVSRIVPVAHRRRDLDRISDRADRLRRVAMSAAKQSKRRMVPEIARPVLLEQLATPDGSAPGIVLDADAPSPLAAALPLANPSAGSAVRLLVGAADGISSEQLEQLVGAGWLPARLGPTILRSELAAPVAVAAAVTYLVDGRGA